MSDKNCNDGAEFHNSKNEFYLYLYGKYM